jgi:hypothetical protein
MRDLDDRAIGVERRVPGHEPEVELDVIRFQGRDVIFVDETGAERIYDAAELRVALGNPGPPCSCGSGGPDEFGNYDQIENPACPRHGWTEAAA